VTSIRSHARSMRGGLECDGIVRPRGPPGLASVLPDLLRRRAAAAGARAAEALRAQRRRGAGAVVARFARGVGPDYVLYPPEGAPEVGGRRVRDEAAAAEACRPEALPPPRVSTASRPWFRVSRWSRSRPHTTLVVVSGGFRMFQEFSGSAGDGHVAAAPPPSPPPPPTTRRSARLTPPPRARRGHLHEAVQAALRGRRGCGRAERLPRQGLSLPSFQPKCSGMHLKTADWPGWLSQSKNHIK
jgi:hypothetical protein